ncbi:MAG: sugar phosphate isomerase/epimerase family protein [Vicinamibacterales bacterium]
MHRLTGGLAIAITVLIATLTLSGRAAPTAQVRIGYCVGLGDLEIAKAAGFDFAEVRVGEIMALSDAEFDALVVRARAIGLPTPAAYQFLPASMRLTGPQPTSPEIQMAYVTKAFGRLARLGVRVVGFGSGTARRVPDGFSKDVAFAQLAEFSRRVATIARAHDIVVAIEPQRPEESNIINSIAEALTLIDAVKAPNFQLLADFFHMASVKENPAVIRRAGAHVYHLHIANPNGRVFPLGWDEYDYAGFFQNLRAIGYGRLISIEASSANVAADGPRTIALLRAAFEGTADPSTARGRTTR